MSKETLESVDKAVDKIGEKTADADIIKPFGKEDYPYTRMTRRLLPHWECAGCTYYVTMRVMPYIGPIFLQDFQSAKYLQDALFWGHNSSYAIRAYVIMPDHAHFIIKPLPEQKLSNILRGIKCVSANKINERINTKGPFWQRESFDHIIRSQKAYERYKEYIHDNPVKGRLVKKASDYFFSNAYVTAKPNEIGDS